MRKLFENPQRKEYFVLILLLILTVPAIAPLLRPDFFHFSDEVHIANLYQMYRSITSGQFPPRLAPDMSYGFGYPLFNYYYVMPFYIGVLFYQLFGSFVFSYKLVLLLATILSVVFMYIFLRKFTTIVNSAVGSLVYLYTPYRAVDLYVRGALGEIFAFMMFPLIGILVYRVGVSKKWKNVGIFALLFAFFVLSHNLSPFLILPWYVLFFLIINKTGVSGILKFSLGLILAVAVASYWFLPAILESPLLKQIPTFNFYDHFPLIRQLVFSKWGYGASIAGIGDDMSFQIGIPNLILIASASILLIANFRKKADKLLSMTLISLLFILFMMNVRSTFLWRMFSFSDYIQFPWRLLLLTSFLSSFLIIFIKNKILLSILVILTLYNMRYFVPSEYFSPDDNYFLHRYFANQKIGGETASVSDEYPSWTEDYAILPKWVDNRADFLPPSRLYSNDLELVNYKRVDFASYRTNVLSEGGGRLQTYIYYFPGWSGYLNGRKIESEIESPHGTMLFNIPAGNWDFELKWEETTSRRIFDIISAFGFGISIVIIFSKLPRNEK